MPVDRTAAGVLCRWCTPLSNPDDKTRWLVDEEAAITVRRIFSLCIQGKGVAAIATALWEDKVLIPSAYKASKGIGVAKKSAHPYNGEPAVSASILENVAYIGVTESFKSTRLGFKSKKRIPTAKDRRTYMEDAHALSLTGICGKKCRYDTGEQT